MVEKFRLKFGSIRGAFQTLDVRGDGRVDTAELRSALAEKFDIALDGEVATAIVQRYNASPPGQPAAFDFASFAEMYDGAFTRYYASSIGAKPAASSSGVCNAFDFTTGQHSLTAVDPTAQQAALATLRRIGASPPALRSWE